MVREHQVVVGILDMRGTFELDDREATWDDQSDVRGAQRGRGHVFSRQVRQQLERGHQEPVRELMVSDFGTRADPTPDARGAARFGKDRDDARRGVAAKQPVLQLRPRRLLHPKPGRRRHARSLSPAPFRAGACIMQRGHCGGRTVSPGGACTRSPRASA